MSSHLRTAGLAASLAVVLAGALSGLFWIPLRQLEAWGLTGGWASLGFFVAALPVMAPLALWRRREIGCHFVPLFVTGCLTGGAFVCYALSLLLTDIVRALLFFYVTPLWGTLLAWIVLREALTPRRLLSLAMALAGLAVIVAGGDAGAFALQLNLGDALGLLSGLLWAFGTFRIYRAPHGGGLEQGMGFFAGASLLAVPALLLLPPESAGPVPPLEAFLQAAPLAVVAAGLIYLPAMSLVFWAALRLDPGRVGLLLMSEVVIGLISAALLTSEPFGFREALGAALIVGASLAETLPLRRRKALPAG